MSETDDPPAYPLETVGDALLDEMLELSRECGRLEGRMETLSPKSAQLILRQLARDAFELLIAESKDALLGADPGHAIDCLIRLQLLRTEREQRRPQPEARN